MPVSSVIGPEIIGGKAADACATSVTLGSTLPNWFSVAR
jgi:hypothetical protein